MTSNNRTAGPNLPGDIVLTEEEIAAFGFDEAPPDAGQSLEDLTAERSMRLGHG